MGVGGQRYAPAALPPPHPTERSGTRFIGDRVRPRAGLEEYGKSRSQRTVQPAASRYTDRAIPLHSRTPSNMAAL